MSDSGRGKGWPWNTWGPPSAKDKRSGASPWDLPPRSGGGGQRDPFDEMIREMDEIFGSLFGGDDRGHSAFGKRFPGAQFGGDSQSGHWQQPASDSGIPPLSAINPQLTDSSDVSADCRTPHSAASKPMAGRRQQPFSGFGDVFSAFKGFFEPELEQPSLGNVNPDFTPHYDDQHYFADGKHDGFHDPSERFPFGSRTDDGWNPFGNLFGPFGGGDSGDHNPSVAVPSPYIPNWNAAEVQMPVESYYRYTTVSSNAADGRVTRKSTYRDSNGQSHTSEQTFEGSGSPVPVVPDEMDSLFGSGFGSLFGGGVDVATGDDSHSRPTLTDIVADDSRSAETRQITHSGIDEKSHYETDPISRPFSRVRQFVSIFKDGVFNHK